MVQTGLTNPPFGYNINGGAGGIYIGGNVGTAAVFNDLNVQPGTGTVTFAGNNNRIAAGFSDAGSTTAITGNYTTAYFATYNGAVSVGDGTNAANMTIGSDVRYNGGLAVNNNAVGEGHQLHRHRRRDLHDQRQRQRPAPGRHGL